LNLDRECRIYVPPIRPINLVIEEETDSGVKDTELLELPFRPSKKVSVITSMRASGRR